MTDWNGQTLSFNYHYPNYDSAYDSGTLTANGVPYLTPETFFTLTVSAVSANVEQVQVNFPQGVNWNYAAFNGFTLTGPASDAPIIGVQNMTGGYVFNLGASANVFYVNWEGVSYTPGTTLVFDLTFASPTPTLTALAPSALEKGQSTVIGVVSPPSAGDTLTLTQTGGTGTVALGPVVNGQQQVIYTAPGASGSAVSTAVAYTVTDAQTGGAVSGSATVALDPGPAATAVAATALQGGQTEVVGYATPGLAGDTLSIQKTGGAGSLSLGAVQSNGQQAIVYTAPASVAADATDTVTYVVSDQHQDAQASGSASVALQLTPTLVSASVAAIDGVADETTGDLDAGHVVTIALDANTPLFVSGAPTLTLSNGASATYVGGSGTTRLTFAYTVAAGDGATTSLAPTGLTGGTVTDGDGLALSPLGALPAFAGLQIDTVAPTLLSTTIAAPTVLGVGDTATISLALSKPVHVSGGVPALTLNDGSSATFAGTSANGATLLFTYTAKATDGNVSALAVDGVTLNGAVVADAAGNVADLSGAATSFSVGVDVTPPRAGAPSAATDSGASDLNAGHVVTITVPFSKTVAIQGAPTLLLSDGATATYVGGAGSAALTFQYTVGAGDHASDLQVVELASGAIIDHAGNTLANAISGDLALQIDTAAPKLIGLSATADNGAHAVNAGHFVTVSLTADKPLFVDNSAGVATLQLSDGATAAYVSGSGTATLTFGYTTAYPEQSADLQVAGLLANGGKIADGAGNAFTAVAGDLGLVIDTSTPVIQSVVATADNRASLLDAGHVITLTLTTSRPVTVDASQGAPSLLLSGGRVAHFVGQTGATTLAFAYNVGAQDNAPDLLVSSLSLNGAVIASPGGTALTGSAAADLGIALDTTPPSATSVTAVSDTGATDLNAGHVIAITVGFSEPVVVDVGGGTPTLALSDGRSAVYQSGSGTASLLFTTVVQPGDAAANLQVASLALNGATIADRAGNALSGAVAGALGLTIDTSAPVTSLTATPDAGPAALKAGRVATLVVHADKPLFVTGSPQLALNDGGSASYVGGSGTSTLTFSYTVGANDVTDDLKVTGVTLNGGAIRDGAGNAAAISGDLALAVHGPAPTATLSASAGAGPAALAAGRVVTLTLTGSEPLFVGQSAGGPRLTLSDGGTATYLSGSGTSTLTFAYTVGAGQTASDLKATGLDTSGGGIADAAGNALASFGADLGYVVDTAAPTATLTAVSDNGALDLNAGRLVTITLTADKPISVDTTFGSPTLALNDGGQAVYVGGSGTNALTFAYRVAPGDNVAALRAVALNANGAAVVDHAGNAFASVSGALGLQIDTQAPTVTSVAASPSHTALPGQTVTITLTMSEAVHVSGGAPTLTLSDGGVATYDAAATAALGQPGKLIFDYPVAFDQASTPELAVSRVALNGAHVTDAAGNDANFAALAGAGLGLAVSTDIDWVGGSGFWTDATKWSAGFAPGAANTLVLNGTKADTITLDGAGAARSLTMNDANALLFLNGQLTLSGALATAGVVDAQGGSLDAGGGVTVATGGEILVDGPFEIAGPVINNSQGLAGLSYTAGLDVRGDLLVTGPLTGGGTTAVSGRLELLGAAAQTIRLSGGGQQGADLRLDAPDEFYGTIANVSSGSFAGATNLTRSGADIIDLAGVTPGTVAFDGQRLTGTTASGAAFSLAVSGATASTFKDATFTEVSDNQGGTAISWVAGLTDVWTGGASGAFDDAGNWSLGLAPGTFDTAEIDGAAPTTITLAATRTFATNFLDVNNSATVLKIAGAMQLGATPHLGGAEINLEGGSLQFLNEGELDSGVLRLDDGSVEVVPVYGGAYFGPAFNQLTLGSGLTIIQGAGVNGAARIGGGVGLYTAAHIEAGVAGGSFTLAATPLSGGPSPGGNSDVIFNSGVIDVSNDDQLIAGGDPNAPVAFYNSGQISIGAGSSATLGSASWSNSGTIHVGAGATLTLDGGYDPASLTGIVNQGGTVILNGLPTGTPTYDFSGGAWIVDPSYAVAPAFSPFNGQNQQIANGVFTIESGASLEFKGDPTNGDTSTGTVVFNGPGATLKLDGLSYGDPQQGFPGGAQPTYFQGQIQGLAAGDAIDFVNQTINSVDDSNGLTVTGPQGVALLGADSFFTQDSLQLSSDGAGGTLLKFIADHVPPAVVSVAATTANGASDIGAGTEVTITLGFREPVAVTGTPTLQLSNGGVASYAAGSGASTLTFVYSPTAGQDTSDLAITGFNFTQGTIDDLAGNALAAAYSAPLGVQIDTQSPIPVKVQAPPTIATPGQLERITVTLSEAVSVSGGPPVLRLDNGGAASYDAAATAKLNNPDALVFDYTVGGLDLSEAAPKIASVDLQRASVVDGAGNAADLSSLVGRTLGFGVNTDSAAVGSGPLYFIADDGAGAAVWESNGTAAGTQKVTGGYSGPANVTATSDDVFFFAGDASGDEALYEITGGQAQEIQNFPAPQGGFDGGFGPPPQPPFVSTPVAVGDKLFYMESQNNGGTLLTLWATDGTSAPVQLQGFYEPLNAFGAPTLYAANGRVYFLAPDNTGAETAWSSDGTVAGTLELPQTYMDAFGNPIPISNLIGLSQIGSNIALDTASGTLLYDTQTGQYLPPNTPVPSQAVKLGGDVYALEGVLTKTDAAGNQTVLGNGLYTAPANLTVSGNTLFFTASDFATGQTTLWATHGTDATTVELTSANGAVSDFANLTAAASKLFYTAWDPAAGATRLFVSDGTAAGTHELATAGAAPDNPQNLTADGSKLYFSATDAAHGTELWSSDGTAVGTKLVSDLATGAVPSQGSPLAIGKVGGVEIFAVYDPLLGGYTLARSDGTAANTALLTSASGAAYSFGSNALPSAAQEIGDALYFVTSTPNGGELWKTDGTSAGTRDLGAMDQIFVAGSSLYGARATGAGGAQTLYSLDPATGAATPVALPAQTRYEATTATLANGGLYFTARDASGADGLYLASGAAAAQAVSGMAGVTFGSTVTAGSTLYGFGFSGSTATLYAVHGAAATSVVAIPNQNSAPGSAIAFGSGLAYVVGGFLGDGGALWVSDGTAAGTHAVSVPAQTTIHGYSLTSAGSRVYFLGSAADGTTHVYSAAASGGAATDVTPAGSLDVGNLIAAGSDVYFLSYDSTGYSLWKTDGTAASTAKISGGFKIPYPGTQSASGSTLFFTAQDAATSAPGLWSVSAGATSAQDLTSGGVTIQGVQSNPNGTVGDVYFAGSVNGQSELLHAGANGVVTDLTAGLTFPQSSSPTSLAAGPIPTQAGTAIDGYIVGASVFADANNNGVWDTGEVVATTDSQGNFVLQGGSGPLVLVGGVDSITGLANTTTYTAPAGSTVVTPLTTLTQDLVAGGASESAAEAEVAQALGLPSGVSLTSFDPVAAALAGDAAGATVFAAGVKVADTLALISTALTSSPIGAASSAYQAATEALAQAVAAAHGPLALGASSVVASVLQAAEAKSGVTLPAGFAAAVAQVVAASNQALDSAVAGAGAPSASLKAGGSVSYVAQHQTQTEIASASPTLVADNTGQALQNAVAQAASNVTCFAAGTRLRTARGDVPVEALAIGDLVATKSGALAPIRWLGHRRIDCRRWSDPYAVYPIRVAADAFGPGRPCRDLYLSPAHAVGVEVVEDVLIPIGRLVNGSTVAIWPCDEVTYWHVELDRHDLLIAENMPAESYLEFGNRSFFQESPVVSLHTKGGPDVRTPSVADFCLPFHETGALVEAVRRQLGERARRLGWSVQSKTRGDVWLEADGARIAPEIRGESLTFRVPEGARTLALHAAASRPCDLGESPDERPLGLCIRALTLIDASGSRTLPADDPRLTRGFYEVEREGEHAWRWTAHRAELDPSLWGRPHGDARLVVDLLTAALPGWTPPPPEALARAL